MDETKDRELFSKYINWIVFVFLIVILFVINMILMVTPFETDAKGVLLAVGLLINLIFWIDSFFWLRTLPNRRYLTHYNGRLAFIGNIPIFAPLRLLQIWLFYRKLGKLNINAARDIRVKRNSQGVLLFFLFIAIVVFQAASVLVLLFESVSPNSNIITSGDALWWSFVTVATVGYGDLYPITAGGRIVALFLMIVGIAMFGIFTSSLSDWFRRPRRLREISRENNEENRSVTVAEMQQMLDQQSQQFQETIDDLVEKLSKIEDD